MACDLFDYACAYDSDILFLECEERGQLPEYLDNETKREHENWHRLNMLLRTRAPKLKIPIEANFDEIPIEMWNELIEKWSKVITFQNSVR
jgi:hypothetical protein